MSYYTDLDEALGWEEQAAEHMREWEFQQRHKQKSFDRAVSAEVKRQLSKLHPELKPKVSADKSKQKPKGKTEQVNCKCCGKEFIARLADLNRGWGKFCSKSCKAKKQESQTGQYKSYLCRTIKRL